MRRACQRLKGAYALVVTSPRKLIGARDPYGFKPLCIGKRDNSYIITSETCALDTVGAEFIRDVEPGEIIVINEGHMIAKDTPDNLTREMVEKNGIHLVAKGTKDKIKTALRTVPGIRDVKYDSKNEEGTLGLTLYMTPGAEIREDIFYAMVKADCPIYELHPLAASLEDAFLALTRGGSRQYGGKKTKKQAAKAEETAQEAQKRTVESASATQEQQKEEE